MDTQTETAPQWAIIELMGHVRYGGLVSKDNQLGTAMLRVDVPMPDGTTVTQLVNPTSIYRMTFCDEALARVAARSGQAKPISTWDIRNAMPTPEKAGEALPPGMRFAPEGPSEDNDEGDEI